MANPTITNIDTGSPAIEIWGRVDGTLQNVEITEQTYLPGTLLTRNSSNGNIVPYAPGLLPDAFIDVTHDYANIPTLEAVDDPVVVAGARVGDIVTIEPLGTWPVGITLPQGRVLVDGTVQVRVANVTAGAVNPGSQTLRFFLERDVELPKFVLISTLVVPASSSAPVQALSAGKVDKNRLRVHIGTAISAAMLDDLMDRPIVVMDVKQLAKVDNPQP